MLFLQNFRIIYLINSRKNDKVKLGKQVVERHDPMDFNQYNQNNYYQQPIPPKKNTGFAIASMICGIVSLVLCCMGLGLPLGALAILFGILTRRKGQRMESMATAGIITGSIGLFMGLIVYIFTLLIFEDPSFQKGMYDSFEEAYGEDYADMMGELYGFDLDEIKDSELED